MAAGTIATHMRVSLLTGKNTMIVNNRQRVVLIGVFDDEQRIANLDVGQFDDLPRQQRGRCRLRLAAARAGLVPIDLLGWLGREPTNSERVLFHREYIRLEDMGLIERCNLHGSRGRRRTTHLRLTPAGRRVAEDWMADAEPADESDPPLDLDALVFLPIEWPSDTASGAEDNDVS
ncbi:MAG: hypothetical protein GC162_00705 [Planctomycetes bacterium]|nr:hypothetical protein [Planctomycetota bacterium]